MRASIVVNERQASADLSLKMEQRTCSKICARYLKQNSPCMCECRLVQACKLAASMCRQHFMCGTTSLQAPDRACTRCVCTRSGMILCNLCHADHWQFMLAWFNRSCSVMLACFTEAVWSHVLHHALPSQRPHHGAGNPPGLGGGFGDTNSAFGSVCGGSSVKNASRACDPACSLDKVSPAYVCVRALVRAETQA